MYDAAVSLGVPAEALVLDYAGRSTYTPVIRARAIFGLSRAVLVDPGLSPARALFLCNSLGLEAFGGWPTAASISRAPNCTGNIREIFATGRRLFGDVIVAHPLPVLGDPLPIS